MAFLPAEQRGFLRDVLTLGLSSFGGPQAHISLMLDLLVERRKLLSEKELMELNALCQFLPGPTSTQTLTAIGLRLGGQRLAWLTLLVWITPACLLMTMIALMFHYIEGEGFELEVLRFVRPIAIGFITVAAWRLTKTMLSDAMNRIILALSVVLTLLLTSSFIFPTVLLIGGLISNYWPQEEPQKEPYNLRNIRWQSFWVFLSIFTLAAVLGNVFKIRELILFENLYRFGSLVFGGGQVLIPMMFEHYVQVKEFMSPEQFLSGYGISQAIPGPVFSFAAYIGAMVFQESGQMKMLLGAVIGAVGINLPGTLLIFFVYPAWEELKKMRTVKKSLNGLNAAAAGLMVAAAILLLQPIGFNATNLAVVAGTFVLNYQLRLPPLLIVTLGLIGGLLVL